MTKKEHHTQPNTDRTSYSFQTLNMAMQDKPNQPSTMNKFLISSLEVFKRIHWFTLLLILILGWSSYQVVNRSPSKYQWIQDGWYQVKQSASAKQPTAPSHSSMAIESNNPPKTTADESAAPSSVAAGQVSLKQTSQAVSGLKEDKSIREMEQRILRMETSGKQLNLQMAALQRNARSLDSQIRRLNQTINRLSSVPAESPRVAQTTTTSSTTPSDDKTPPQAKEEHKAELSYTLHAVIPGRAWLNTSEGKIITVSVGSPIPPYGLVQMIDSTRGVVYCSTGATIKFSTQEY